ncbi:MAG: DUF1269 domain-containing protein [Gammaproteobacteria bacterium]
MNRHRLYFLLPDIGHTRILVENLRAGGLSRKYIHVLANDDTPLNGLNEAGILEKTELKNGLQKGISVGGAAGLIAGLLAATFPPAGVVLAGSAVMLATTAAGAGAGALVSTMLSKDETHREVKRFCKDIRVGKVLVMVDVPPSSVQMVHEMVMRLDPKTDVGMV